MQIYLPIAEMAVSAETIVCVSAFVGFLSGIFGIGGGFLTTPFLIFMGIPPTIAVGTQASQLVASSSAGVMAHWGRGNVDVKMGLVMMIGGLAGSVAGTFIFMLLEYFGQIDFAISVLYIVLLGSIGTLMLIDSFSQLASRKKNISGEFNHSKMNSFINSLPYKMRFARSRLYISALVPIAIGFVGGLLTSILGVGGGFIIVPAMIYLLGMPALLVAGTSLYQMIFTTAFATIMHAIANQSVDLVLALILIAGGVVGAQIGVAFSGNIKGHYARVTLALIVLAVCLQLIFKMFVMPGELFFDGDSVMKKYILAFLMTLVAGAAYAQANFLTIDLAKNHIDINTGFHGTYLQLFGVKESPGDIAVTIEGPTRTMNVRRKEEISGAWINKDFETFENVPSFYAYASSKPLPQLAPPDVLDANQIGVEHLQFKVKTKELDPPKLVTFRQALIRNKQSEGLFAGHGEEIVFLNPNFFRTQFYMPANVPVGDYTVKSFYLQDGVVRDIRTSVLKVGQVGLSADLFEFAHRKRFLYALVCIAVALFAGWFSNRVYIKR